MLYKIKQKIWAWDDSYAILDENENPVFQVYGKPFSWGDNLSIQDVSGNELATIHQKLLTLKPRYEIYRVGNLFAEVVKEFSWFNSKFTLDVPGPNDYEITGSFWEYEYQFVRGGRIVAEVSKALWAWSDTYGVRIEPGEDDIAILATVMVVDLVCHDR